MPSPSSELRDGMRIDWDMPIAMEDGLVLRADVFRPTIDGRYPVLLSHGPYAKGLAFQEGYPSAWQRMGAEHPDVAYGSTNLYQNWEVVDPEKRVLDGYVCVRVDSRDRPAAILGGAFCYTSAWAARLGSRCRSFPP